MNARPCPIAATCPRVPRASGPPPSLDKLSRREWVKTFAIGSATVLGLGGASTPLLADISPAANPANVLSFNLGSYPALQAEYGSVQFNLFGNPSPTVPNCIITVTRAPGNVFHAVSAYCTHAGTITDIYYAGDTNAIICYGHGSVYDIQGHVITEAIGGQANLPYYNSSLSGNTLRVEIPNLNFKVNALSVASVNGATKRFQITFPARTGAKYRVLHTPDLATAPVAVNFAKTIGGGATSTPYTHTTANTENRSLWVDSTVDRGFYMVEMMITQYA